MSSSSQPAQQELKKVRDFLAAIPPNSTTVESNVTFDSKRDSNESELCRKLPGGGASCMKVYLSSTALFATIQKLGYLCMAPVDPASTEIHCTRIAAGPVAPELDVGRTSNPTPPVA